MTCEVLLEMYAFVGDGLTFCQDNLARESRLVTATQRKNVMALARMLGYRLRGAQAATAEIVLALSRTPAAAVTIPAGAVVRTQEVTEPVRFHVLAPVVIPAGASPASALAVVEHSKTHTQLFDARGLAGLEVCHRRFREANPGACVLWRSFAWSSVMWISATSVKRARACFVSEAPPGG